MAFRTLVDTGTLAIHLGNPDWAVVDSRLDLTHFEWGAREYEKAHIPGAVFADMARDLAGPKTGTNGRHPLPDPETLAWTLGRFGIDDRVQVVVYDQDIGMYAARLWWMLRWLGHEDVAVLDGGWSRWIAEGRPVRTGVESRAPRAFAGTPRSDLVVNAEQVAALASSSHARLVDARAPERYRGEIEPIDRVGGHIPGAVNHFYKLNVTDEGQLRSPEDLAARWTDALAGAAPEQTISYCGSGITACHNILALEHAGLSGAKLYPGSWSEWSSDPERPIETGQKTKT